MPTTNYEDDLAYIHDAGFGGFAAGIAPGVLSALRDRGVESGRIVDLGCGSGIWARALADAGFDVTGVDISPAMVAMSKRRVPEGEFHVKSFLEFAFPACRAVTALGEVLNYLLDESHSLRQLKALFRRVYAALEPGGVFVFDVAEPGRARGRTQMFSEGNDWACLVEFQHDNWRHRLTRRIVTFRKTGKFYRRHQESHTQQLFRAPDLVVALRSIGFRVRTTRNFGDYALFPKHAGIIARKP